MELCRKTCRSPHPWNAAEANIFVQCSQISVMLIRSVQNFVWNLVSPPVLNEIPCPNHRRQQQSWSWLPLCLFLVISSVDQHQSDKLENITKKKKKKTNSRFFRAYCKLSFGTKICHAGDGERSKNVYERKKIKVPKSKTGEEINKRQCFCDLKSFKHR